MVGSFKCINLKWIIDDLNPLFTFMSTVNYLTGLKGLGGKTVLSRLLSPCIWTGTEVSRYKALGDNHQPWSARGSSQNFRFSKNIEPEIQNK